MNELKLPELWYQAATQQPDWQLKQVIEMLPPDSSALPDWTTLNRTLFGVDDVWRHYQPQPIGPDLLHKNGLKAHISQATLACIEDVLGRRPRFGVEVGSFVGASAILLGNWLRAERGMLLCVDTWCGDINMWLHPRFASVMAKEDGDPKLYHHFMQNIIKAGLTDTVMPLRVTSVVAARMLKVLGYRPDFVYLDSAHEAGETFLELSLYWDLLAPGGVLLGDDYRTFPAVGHDVDLFIRERQIERVEFPEEGKDTFVMVKPAPR